MIRGADEIERATDRTQVAAAGDLGIDLSRKVDLDRRIHRDEALDAGEHPHVVRVFRGAQPHQRIFACEVEKLARAHDEAADHFGDDAALREIDDAVAERTGMHAQACAIAEERKNRIGQRAEAEFERRTVRDEGRRMARDGSFGLAGCAIGQGNGRPGRRHRKRKVAFSKQTLSVDPRNLVVHLGDHRPADLERRHQVFGGKSEAVFAACVGRADLQQHDVGANGAGSDQRSEPRIRMRVDVEHAGIGERPVVPSAAIRA